MEVALAGRLAVRVEPTLPLDLSVDEMAGSLYGWGDVPEGGAVGIGDERSPSLMRATSPYGVLRGVHVHHHDESSVTVA
jgi:hypothetical protein